MKVDFYGTYRLLVGEKTVEVSLPPGGVLIDLLDAVCAAFPALHKELFDEHGNLFAYIPLFVNGRNPRLLDQGLHMIIGPQDVLSIFSPIASGRLNVEQINQSLSVDGSKERPR